MSCNELKSIMLFHYSLEHCCTHRDRYEAGVVGLAELKTILPKELGKIVERYKERESFKIEFISSAKIYRITKLDRKIPYGEKWN